MFKFLNGRYLNQTHLTIQNQKEFEIWAPPVVQWGSEYQTSLVFKWSKLVRLPNGLLFECHLNAALNLVWDSDRHLNTGLVFEWWSEYQTTIWIPDIWIPDKWKFAIQMFPLFRCSLFRSPLYLLFKTSTTFKWCSHKLTKVYTILQKFVKFLPYLTQLCSHLGILAKMIMWREIVQKPVFRLIWISDVWYSDRYGFLQITSVKRFIELDSGSDEESRLEQHRLSRHGTTHQRTIQSSGKLTL